MKYKILIIFLLLIHPVIAGDVFVINTDGQTYNITEGEGIATNKEDGDYRAVLIGYNNITIHEQNFSVKSNKESFPGPECFDEEGYILYDICPDPFSNNEVIKNVTIKVPKLISGKYINIYEREELKFSINVSVKVGADQVSEEENNTKTYLIAGIILLAIIIIGLIIFKNKR